MAETSSLKVISRGVSTIRKGLDWRWRLSEDRISLSPFSAVTYMVSPLAVTKVDETVVVLAAVVVDDDLPLEVTVVGDLVLLVPLLVGEDKEMYRGWDLKEGRSGNL